MKYLQQLYFQNVISTFTANRNGQYFALFSPYFSFFLSFLFAIRFYFQARTICLMAL